MLRKSKKLFRSIVCLLLAVTMLFTSNVEYAFAAFGGDVAPVTITTSSHPKYYSIASNTYTSRLVGRYLIGAGWVFSIARYNTSASAGYEALSVNELARAYQDGVLVYNDVDFGRCASGHRNISQEISGHDLHVGSNALISPGYYFEDLEFLLQGYSASTEHGGAGYYSPDLLYGGYAISEVTNSGDKMSCVPFSQSIASGSDTKLQLSTTDNAFKTKYISGVYKIKVSDQHGVAFSLGKLDKKHAEGYPKVKITCPCNNTSNCGSDVCGHYVFSRHYANSTCEKCQYNKHNSKVENGVTKYEYKLEDGSTDWSIDDNLLVGNSLGGSKVVSKVMVWSGCGCNSSSYCTSCRKLDFSGTCGCATGNYTDANKPAESECCDKCDYTWTDKAKVSVDYKTYDGTVAEMFNKLSAWQGLSDDVGLASTGVTKIPTDFLNITNGVWEGSGVGEFNVASSSNAPTTGKWTEVARELLGEASNVSKKYEEGDYILEEDFPVLDSYKNKKVYYNNDIDKFTSIKNLISGGEFTVSATGSEVSKDTDSITFDSDIFDSAVDKAIEKLDDNQKYREVKSVFDIDEGYSKDGWNPSQILRTTFSYYINYEREAGTKPIGVAKTLSNDGGAINMQYNFYSTGGHVSIRGGNESSFNNGLFNSAGDGDGSRCTGCANHTICNASKEELHRWYGNRVGAYTTEVTGMHEFGNLVSDKSRKFTDTNLIGTDLKINASTTASQVSSTIGKDISRFNELWAVIDGSPNKEYDLNNADYRRKLYNQLVTLKGSEFSFPEKNNPNVMHKISEDEFVDNEVYGEGEDWIYVIVAVPVVLIENYISGVTAEDNAALSENRGQTTLAVYPSCEFLRYDGSLDNNNADSVGNILLGQETYSIGGYLGCFAGMSGVYSVGHKQYLSSEDGGATWDVVIGSGVTGQIRGTTYTTSEGRITYDGVKKVFKDENMDLKPDNNVPVEPDFKGFVVYGANLDMSVRLASNVTAYLDSTSFDATSDETNVKNYTGVDFSNIGVHNYTLNEDEKDNKVALDTTPYDVSLSFSYTTKGLRYWYSSQELNPVKKLYRTALEKDIATSDIVGISTNADKKTNMYTDYDILNETSQFYIKSGKSDSKFLLYKKDDVNGDYLHNIVQYAKDRTKIKYNGIGIGGEISFGKLYTTSVVYDTAKSSATLAGALYNKIDKLENWSGKGFVNYNDLTAKKNRYVDRGRRNYSSLKTRGMVLGARLLVNGLELVDTVDNNNNNLDRPGRFMLSGSEENGYSAVGNGQYATVSVQVYEKRKKIGRAHV